MASTREIEDQMRNLPVRVNRAAGTNQSNDVFNKSVTEAHMALLCSGQDSDVTFIVGPTKQRIPCHQLFLKVRSPVFQTMFSGRWNQGSKDITIPDISPEVFQMFLKFVYTDKFGATVREALHLLRVAHLYDVGPLVQKCEELLEHELRVEDAVAVFEAARKYERTELMEKAGKMMAKSIDILASDESLMTADQDTLIYLLSREDLKTNEVDLFEYAIMWGKHRIRSGAGGSLHEVLSSILPLIRFPLMTLPEFTSVVVPTRLLPESTLVQIFTYFGSDEGTKKKLAKSLPFSVKPREENCDSLPILFYKNWSVTGGSSVSSGAAFVSPLQSLGSEVWGYTRAPRMENFAPGLFDSMSFTVDSTLQDGNYSKPRRREREIGILYASILMGSLLKTTTSGFAITSLILMCPVKQQGQQGQQFIRDHGDSNGFIISILKRRNATSSLPHETETTEVFSTTLAELDWGSEMEVQVDPPLSLKRHTMYTIRLQELDHSRNVQTVYRCCGGDPGQPLAKSQVQFPGPAACMIRNIVRNRETMSSGYSSQYEPYCYGPSNYSQNTGSTCNMPIIKGIRVSRVDSK